MVDAAFLLPGPDVAIRPLDGSRHVIEELTRDIAPLVEVFRQTPFPHPTTTASVTQAYHDVLGRAPDAPGLSFRVNALDDGTHGPGQVVESLMLSAPG